MHHTVTIIDSIMGSGKTTHLIDTLNKEAWAGKAGKVIFITPTLSEVDRITAACPALDFKNPLPEHGKGKYYDLTLLVEAGENICTTHALFRLLGRDLQALLKKHHYRLVIDEALDVVEQYTGLTRQDLDTLISKGWITIEESTGVLVWHDIEKYLGKHSMEREMCLNGSLISQDGKLILWEFPISFLDCFRDVTILTYLWHGSVMSSYLAAGGVTFNMKAIHDGQLVSWEDVNEGEIKERLRGLIKVYEGRSNAVGDSPERASTKRTTQPLSSSWYKAQLKGDKEGLAALKKGMVSFFQNEAKTPSDLNLWTTFKDYRNGLSGRGYSKGFVPNNLRATNEFRYKRAAAYTCNTFMHPVVKNYLRGRGVTVYGGLYALSEMLQWIWRTAIREYQTVHLYIPSQRMRELFQAWLKSDTTGDLFTNLGLEQPRSTTTSIN